VAQVKDFHTALFFADKVVNQNWTVQQLAHPRPFADCAAHAGKTRQQSDVVEQRAAKPLSSVAVIFGKMSDDGCEVV